MSVPTSVHYFSYINKRRDWGLRSRNLISFSTPALWLIFYRNSIQHHTHTHTHTHIPTLSLSLPSLPSTSPSVPSWLIRLVSPPLLHLTTMMTCATSSVEQLSWLCLTFKLSGGNWCPEPTAPAFRNRPHIPADGRQRGVGQNLRFEWECPHRLLVIDFVWCLSSACSLARPAVIKTTGVRIQIRFHGNTLNTLKHTTK